MKYGRITFECFSFKVLCLLAHILSVKVYWDTWTEQSHVCELVDYYFESQMKFNVYIISSNCKLDNMEYLLDNL